jgi:hypothetical protein
MLLTEIQAKGSISILRNKIDTINIGVTGRERAHEEDNIV